MSGPLPQVAAGVSGSQPSSVPAGPGPHAQLAACAAWGPGRVDGGTVPGSTGLREGIIAHSLSCVRVRASACAGECHSEHTRR